MLEIQNKKKDGEWVEACVTSITELFSTLPMNPIQISTIQYPAICKCSDFLLVRKQIGGGGGEREINQIKRKIRENRVLQQQQQQASRSHWHISASVVFFESTCFLL
jgi:hypothetical protein